MIEHELGYRGAFGYPQRLRLLCPVCFWQRGPDSAAPTTVVVARDGSAMPLCDEHLTTAEGVGLAMPGSAPAADVQGGLLDIYATDLLPDARVPSAA